MNMPHFSLSFIECQCGCFLTILFDLKFQLFLSVIIADYYSTGSSRPEKMKYPFQLTNNIFYL